METETAMPALLFLVLLFSLSDGRRYRLCGEGCCIHEYCAYHMICYPRIHCRFGCPDGQCVGQSVPAGQSEKSGHKPSDRQESPETASTTEGRRFQVGKQIAESASRKSSQVVDDKDPGGICMPYPPCTPRSLCEEGHSCTYNYNLGYSVCQYNLEIGSTLCYDRYGDSAVKPLT